MPKKLKTKLQDKLKFEYFYNAYLRARKHKKIKREILEFDIDLETNLINLMEKIKNNTYYVGQYRKFIIYEPKRREILSLPYVDRIVHQWYIGEFIKPYIMKRFIKDTYACLDKRGIHKASNVVQKYMRIMKKKYNNYYIIKCDISKYFYSINLDILFELMSSFIEDKELLEFTRKMIYERATSNIGIPIGNYTSQYFANIYLNELDKFVKHKLHIKYYARYMDDFILLVENKMKAKEVFEKIKVFLDERLNLKLNPKSRYYFSSMGLDFCGYRIFETYKLIRKRSVRKIRKKISKWNYRYENNSLNYHKVLVCWNSFLNHASHANCFNLCNRLYEKMMFTKEINLNRYKERLK